MYFEPIEIPDELLEAQEQGRLVIFAGAGVSMGEPSNLPSFEQLAAKIAGSHPLAGEMGSFTNRLDRFLGELSRRNVNVQERCRSIIDKSDSKPTELHRSLVDLFINREDIRIVTTNFDDHFTAVIDGQGLEIDSYHAPALPLGHQFSGLVHLHGSIKRAQPLVLTDEDFGRAYLTEGWAREFLQRLFAEFTTLFVGYSQNDLPVEYLARGMSGRSMAPHFALTDAGEAGKWTSLGIREIAFEKTPGPNRFENLYAGVRKWATFNKLQPTDIAERVKAIVCAPENITPNQTESSLLRRCLERRDSCHFFTNQAKGWRWVKWLQEQGFLQPLFDTSRRELTEPDRHLAYWLAKNILAEESDEGLLLVKKHNGRLGPRLWSALRWRLCRDENVVWGSPLIQKWALLLVQTYPSESAAELSGLLRKIVTVAPKTLGMVLLRRLLSLRIEMATEGDFESLMNRGNTIEIRDKATFEVGVAAGFHELEAVWDYLLKQHLPELAEPLILLLEDRIREGHEIYSAAERADTTFDRNCFRGRIYDRDAYRTGRDMSLVLDCLVDVIEAHYEQGPGLSSARIESWLTSRVPTLVRVGLYALHRSQKIADPYKVKLVQDHNFVYPEVRGATHEAWLVLAACYPALNISERASVWSTINEGPTARKPEDVSPEIWNDQRRHQIDNLTWFLATKNQGCAAAMQALDQLNKRQPNFQGYLGIDQITFGHGTKPEDLRTPRAFADLLQSEPSSQIDWLLKYDRGNAPIEASREGLLDAVGKACAQNQAWGVALLEELVKREAWKSDLGDAVFWRTSRAALAPEKFTWLLNSLESHFSDPQSLQGLTFFLFHRVDFSEDKSVSPENLDLMIRLSLLIWFQLKGAEPPVTEDFKRINWANQAINHPAGRIAEFWLKCCDQRRRGSDGKNAGFPDWLKDPLADMVAGEDYASQLGRAILALYLPLMYEVDPVWTRAQLFPKFQFTVVGEDAFLMWQPRAGDGDLSRELLFVMMPIYREAFLSFLNVESRLQTGFFCHIAAMVYYCLFHASADNWFTEFLTKLTDDQRTNWARQFERVLCGAPEAQKAQIWQHWMKAYWEERLDGIPCSLVPREAEEMLKWAFQMGEVFPETVGLITRGPQVQQSLGVVLHTLEEHEAPLKYPDAVLQLLGWILNGTEYASIEFAEIERVIFRLPKKRSFRVPLNNICERLVSLGYPEAAELKLRVEQLYIEDIAIR